MGNRRGWLMAFVAVLVALLGACSFVPGSLEGRMIYLTVDGSSGARLVDVQEYDVSSLDLEIYDPDEELLWSEVWEPEDGATTYTVPVEQLGTYEIVVVHHMADAASPDAVEERAVFNIAGMMVSVINVTPGAIGAINIDGDEPCSLMGAWEGTVMFPSPVCDEFDNCDDVEWYEALVEMWFNEDGSDEIHGYLSEQDKAEGIYFEELTLRGTYTCADEDGLSGIWTHGWDSESETWEEGTNDEGEPEPVIWEALNLEFSPDCQTVSFDVDFDMGGLVHWELTRM